MAIVPFRGIRSPQHQDGSWCWYKNTAMRLTLGDFCLCSSGKQWVLLWKHGEEGKIQQGEEQDSSAKIITFSNSEDAVGWPVAELMRVFQADAVSAVSFGGGAGCSCGVDRQYGHTKAWRSCPSAKLQITQNQWYQNRKSYRQWDTLELSSDPVRTWQGFRNIKCAAKKSEVVRVLYPA